MVNADTTIHQPKLNEAQVEKQMALKYQQL